MLFTVQTFHLPYLEARDISLFPGHSSELAQGVNPHDAPKGQIGLQR